ncbi:MAG: hypothetical protein HWE30_09235 [Methylocystaceae bacterium]|nr:hypothetical protein [Methylocystaceae bacterium]
MKSRKTDGCDCVLALVRPKLNMMFAGVLSTLLLVGCVTQPVKTQSAQFVVNHRSSQIETMLSQMTAQNELQKLVKVGLEHIHNGEFQKAGKAFEAGLRLEPDNGHLHFLNALSYHLRGQSGDSQMIALAQTGYRTALMFDESNAMAAYLLGQIHFQKREYVAAQNQFSYALMYDPDNPDLLNALATASYYCRDAETLRWASEKAYDLAPERSDSIRNVLFSQAAIGHFSDTPRLMGEYEAQVRKSVDGGNDYWVDEKIKQTQKRVKDWQRFYAQAGDTIFGAPSSDIVTYGSGGASKDSDDLTPRAAPVPSVSTADINKVETSGSQAAQYSEPQSQQPKMTLIDVVIIRTEEVRAQSKGINILDGLQTTLGGVLVSYSYDTSSGANSTEKVSGAPALTLKGLEYNLNIFNNENNKAEIIARPSLLAAENETSKFFSGGVLHVQLSSNQYDGGMEDVNIGITLSVTPTFMGNDELSIQVQAEHEYLEMQSEHVGYDAFSQTTKTSVQAKAVMKFGETLILSGLSERGRDNSENGVPILEDIPVVQYLFSHKEETETKKSTLILLTPRKPCYANETLSDVELGQGLDLERIYTDKLKTSEKIVNSNLNSVMSDLRENSQFYRQFRTGDVTLGFFEDDDSIFGAIKRTLGFLYY